MNNKFKFLLILFINVFFIISCQQVDVEPVGDSGTDDDKDGVVNTADNCPNTPLGSSVDAQGCVIQVNLDTDGDGVLNTSDSCPATPPNTTVDANGCDVNKDTDSDGVIDTQDQCPSTPATDQVDAKGCTVNVALDSDMDGVENAADQCPNTASGTLVDAKGCAINVAMDQDQDGVENSLDQCPDTPMNETANAEGCSEIQLGAKFYVDQSCAACHGTNGLGRLDTPPVDTDYPIDVCTLVDCNDEVALINYMEGEMPKFRSNECTKANGCAQAVSKYMIKYIVKPPVDTDMDGVADNSDSCPATTVGQSVDTQGCSDSQKDDDNDGVKNNIDTCPNTPVGSSVDANGCSIVTSNDTDNDGVLNASDSCPNTPAKFINAVGNDGCSAYDRGFKDYFAKLDGVKSCASCHGDEGQGGTGGGQINGVCSGLNCQNPTELSTYLSNEMPYSKVNLCVDSATSSCASDIASFMQEAFYNKEGDGDIDGIADADDACPTTKSEDASSIDHTGCKSVNLITPVAFAINVGDTGFTSRVNGTIYQADNAKYYENSNGSTQGNPTHDVANTQDDELYRKERWGKNLQYNIPLKKGTYQVELHMAEVYHEEKGKRVMQVFMEGNSVLNNYDIFDKAGGKNVAKIETISDIEVNDDILNIDLNGKTDNASVVAIRILGAQVNDGDKDGVMDSRDTCPGTTLETAVNAEGCSNAQLDKDNDGVLLPLDACPSTPSDQTSSVSQTGRLAGCSTQERSTDTDNDGVADVIDNCVTPPGAKVGVTGCTGNFNLPGANVVSPQMRLTSFEFSNIVMNAFGLNTLPSVTYQGDAKDLSGLFTNNGNETSGDFSALVGAVLVLGEAVSNEFADKCTWESSPGNCVRQHFETPMKTLFREQTISESDIQVIKGLIASSFVDGATEAQAVATGVARILLDDRTVYQMELGVNPQSSGSMLLTGNEFLERVSFALVNNSPDTQLVSQENTIINDAQSLQDSVNRLMQGDDYKENVWLFVADWLSIPSQAGSDLSKIENASVEESKRLVYHIVENNLPITELFTANYSFINKVLADHYGVAEPSQNWEKYNFNSADYRQGILTHASFLMQTGGHGRDVNTIFRGKVVFEGMFCEHMPPTPPAEDSIELAGEVDDRGTHSKCSACHAVVDPIGRMFDRYDDDGKVYSDLEFHGGLYLDVDVADDYDSVPAFVSELTNSQAFNQCIARQLFRFTLGRDAYQAEQSSFDDVRAVLDNASDGTFKSAFSALLTSDTFKNVYVTNDLTSCPLEN